MTQHTAGRLAPAIALVAALTVAFGASALSRRDQNAVDAINARMAAAEAAYRVALVDIGNADPDGQKAADSALEESYSEALEGRPEYPHYTRPAEYRGWRVPDVLLSGHHAE